MAAETEKRTVYNDDNIDAYKQQQLIITTVMADVGKHYIVPVGWLTGAQFS